MEITPRAIESIDNKIGEIQENPTANSVLDRLKRITTEKLTTAETHDSLGGFWPEPGTLTTTTTIGEPTNSKVDSRGNLSIRGPVTTDEGSLREDFSGTTIYYIEEGTLTFTNGSRTVTGVLTTFTDGTNQYADYIRLSTDPDTVYAKIESVISDTELLLENNYAGTTGTGLGYHTKFKPIIGPGGTITVESSLCLIESGTTNNTLTRITRDIDYCPLIFTVNAIISQRIANQTGYIGLTDDAITPTISAYFQFDGIDELIIKTVTQFSAQATDKETNTITLAQSTSSEHRYRLELAQEYAAFYVDDLLVSTHKNHIPSPYAYMNALAGWVNGIVPASTTTMSIDNIFIGNIDALQIITGLSSVPVLIGNTALLPVFTTTSDFQISLEITRPTDTTPYDINDLINNNGSTTLPAFDFSILGDLTNRFIEILSIIIISNNGAITLPRLSPFIHLFNVNSPGFTVTDNSPFSPTYTQMINYRVLSIDSTFTPIASGSDCYLLVSADKDRILKLDASSKVYLALINSNAYIPSSSEKITVILQGRL